MKIIKLVFILFLIVALCFFLVDCEQKSGGNDDNNDDDDNDDEEPEPEETAIIIDHRHTDIAKIPDEWIKKVKELLNVHYAHTSHGEQVTVGLERLFWNGSRYNFWYETCNLPVSTEHLTMLDGQVDDEYCETYVTPELYWQTDEGLDLTRSVLNNFSVNVSLWAWCTQLDDYSSQDAQQYLDRMAQLEKDFPNVTFVYLTGNAQNPVQNRQDRNNQIRDFCQKNKKVLFDFADLDCWYNGQQHFENGVQTEHPQYHGDEAGHTTFESCENKGKAFWWLLARIAGWKGV